VCPIKGNYEQRAKELLQILGKENIKSIDYCTTRLRLEVNDSHVYKESEFEKIQVLGVIRPTKESLQLIIGADVQFLADALTAEFEKGE